MLHDWLNQPGYVSLFFMSFLASTLLPFGSEWLLVLLFFYNINARYGALSRRYGAIKIFADLMVFLSFIVAVCWYTGKVTSPFMSLIYLILMATALTQGRRVTYFMAALAVTSYRPPSRQGWQAIPMMAAICARLWQMPTRPCTSASAPERTV